MRNICHTYMELIGKHQRKILAGLKIAHQQRKYEVKKILIVGGTGFLGFHFAKYCLKRNFKVISVSRGKPKKIRKLNNVNYVFLDISKKKALEKKL